MAEEVGLMFGEERVREDRADARQRQHAAVAGRRSIVYEIADRRGELA
jgi:hypothetical protein